MYSFDCVLEGVKYTVFIFSTFIGHSQPYTPHNPISLDEAYSPERKTFYLAWYSDVDKVNKIYFLEKYWIRSNKIPIPDNIKPKAGRSYYSVKNTPEGIQIGSEIDEKKTIDMSIFYTSLLDAKGNYMESYIIKKGLMDKYSYSYKQNSVLDNVKSEVFDLPD